MDKTIQAMPLAGAVTSPYVVLSEDQVVEFMEPGDVTIEFSSGRTVNHTVLGGSRYSIIAGTKSLTFSGGFSVA